MYRGIFTGFFIFIMLFQSMDRFGLIAFYELNKEYITEMFCVNKSRPEMGCNGKCFLMQKLNQENEQNDNFPSKVLDVKEMQLFPIQKPGKITPLTDLTIRISLYRIPLKSHSFATEIFHPPQSA